MYISQTPYSVGFDLFIHIKNISKINSQNLSHVACLSYNMGCVRSNTEIPLSLSLAVSRRPLSAEIPLRF